jgi:hypothetical protein
MCLRVQVSEVYCLGFQAVYWDVRCHVYVHGMPTAHSVTFQVHNEASDG